MPCFLCFIKAGMEFSIKDIAQELGTKEGKEEDVDDEAVSIDDESDDSA